MKKSIVLSGLCLVACVISGTAQELKLPYYSARPQAADYTEVCEFPNGQPAKVLSPQELDVRLCDISSWDLTQYTAQELADVISFDNKTKFPPKNKLPKKFFANKILQNGKTPGLGISRLHAQGITGKGVSMAIIDQNLLLEHIEYAPNVLFYEEDPSYASWNEASMHGAAVVSIAVGKNTGVAPQARVFALAGKFSKNKETGQFDAQPITAMLRRVKELNSQLPDGQKIRVVSISRGFDESDLGADEFEAAQGVLEKDGVAVFTTNDVNTLSRTHSLDNPENAANYCRPPYWWGKDNVHFLANTQDIVVPTDFRAIASPTGTHDYVHYATAGLSWAVPYVAGLYALGVQVYPQLTKEIFVKAARQTATLQHCEYKGEPFSAPLVNPTALINYLKKLKQ